MDKQIKIGIEAMPDVKSKEEITDEERKRIVFMAHSRICRRKGSEYAPTTDEIEQEINKFYHKK
jgi:hypothetical protein